MRMTDKPGLRGHFCSLRDCKPMNEVSTASAALCRQLAAWPALGRASTILTYLAFRNEPDLARLFDLLPGIHWAVPRIAASHRMMLHCYDPDRLVRHRFGMLEPSAELPQVDPSTLDVVLVPGVAFDRRGGRLGFGGGYYDRFLPTTSALRVGITYDECLADVLPCDPHDQRMDWIATPGQLIRTSRRHDVRQSEAPL